MQTKATFFLRTTRRRWPSQKKSHKRAIPGSQLSAPARESSCRGGFLLRTTIGACKGRVPHKAHWDIIPCVNGWCRPGFVINFLSPDIPKCISYSSSAHPLIIRFKLDSILTRSQKAATVAGKENNVCCIFMKYVLYACACHTVEGRCLIFVPVLGAMIRLVTRPNSKLMPYNAIISFNFCKEAPRSLRLAARLFKQRLKPKVV